MGDSPRSGYFTGDLPQKPSFAVSGTSGGQTSVVRRRVTAREGFFLPLVHPTFSRFGAFLAGAGTFGLVISNCGSLRVLFVPLLVVVTQRRLQSGCLVVLLRQPVPSRVLVCAGHRSGVPTASRAPDGPRLPAFVIELSVGCTGQPDEATRGDAVLTVVRPVMATKETSVTSDPAPLTPGGLAFVLVPFPDLRLGKVDLPTEREELAALLLHSGDRSLRFGAAVGVPDVL